MPPSPLRVGKLVATRKHRFVCGLSLGKTDLLSNLRRARECESDLEKIRSRKSGLHSPCGFP
jgi:hypothetical protein